MFAYAFAQDAKERHLALERARAFGIETELDDAVLFELLVPREPHFTKTALPKAALEYPSGVGDKLPGRWAPPENRLFGRAVETMRLLRIGWRRERREAFLPASQTSTGSSTPFIS